MLSGDIPGVGIPYVFPMLSLPLLACAIAILWKIPFGEVPNITREQEKQEAKKPKERKDE